MYDSKKKPFDFRPLGLTSFLQSVVDKLATCPLGIKGQQTSKPNWIANAGIHHRMQRLDITVHF